ncbi:MAG: flagellar basal body-associated FliL family protein [Pseudomonadota bacterium]
MSDTAGADPALTAEGSAAPKKSGLVGILLGIAALALAGAGGFYVTYSGVLGLPGEPQSSQPVVQADPLAPLAFVSTGEMIITLGPAARAQHLIFEAEIEAEPGMVSELESLKPRILDVFNTYLRAVDEDALENPSTMPRLRAQLLRRLEIVTGDGRVRDLLITRFILR